MKHRALAVVCFALSAAVQLFFSQETELFYMFLFFSLGVIEYVYSFPKLRAGLVWCFSPYPRPENPETKPKTDTLD